MTTTVHTITLGEATEPVGPAAVGLAATGTDGVTRVIARADVEVADEATDEATTNVIAWPSVYGRPYQMGAYTWHQIEPGAFAESAAEQDGRVPVYAQHGWAYMDRPPIGHTTAVADSTREQDGADGMRIVADLYRDVPDGLAVARALEARALREWSLGYRVLDYRVVEDDDNGRTILVVERGELLEASVVLRGANPYTSTEDTASRSPAAAGVLPDEPAGDPAGDTTAAALAALDNLEVELAACSPTYRAAWRRTDDRH